MDAVARLEEIKRRVAAGEDGTPIWDDLSPEEREQIESGTDHRLAYFGGYASDSVIWCPACRTIVCELTNSRTQRGPLSRVCPGRLPIGANAGGSSGEQCEIEWGVQIEAT